MVEVLVERVVSVFLVLRGTVVWVIEGFFVVDVFESGVCMVATATIVVSKV